MYLTRWVREEKVAFVQSILHYIYDPKSQYGLEATQTLTLSVYAVLLAIVISIPLGIIFSRSPLAAFIATNVSGLARSIPTLAFLGLLIQVPGFTGFTPSVLALTLLGIPPILLNTVAGMRGLDPAVIDAARGVGMTGWQTLWRVRIPLVLPVIAAGVRTSAVQIVATSPLAALIGGGTFGDSILLGLSGPAEEAALIAGALGVAVLALLTEFGLAGVQRLVTPAGLKVSQGAQERAEAAQDQSLAAPQGGSLAA